MHNYALARQDKIQLQHVPLLKHFRGAALLIITDPQRGLLAAVSEQAGKLEWMCYCCITSRQSSLPALLAFSNQNRDGLSAPPMRKLF